MDLDCKAVLSGNNHFIKTNYCSVWNLLGRKKNNTVVTIGLFKATSVLNAKESAPDCTDYPLVSQPAPQT